MSRGLRNSPDLDEFLLLLLKERRRAGSLLTSVGKSVPPKRRRSLLAFAVLCALVGTATVISWPFMASHPTLRPIEKLNAALIDELSITDPDPQFLANATETLVSAGYHVSYYRPSQASVGFFETLPTLGYGLIVIRAHSSNFAIVTSQRYSQDQFTWSQLTGSVADEKIDNGLEYFAITADFVVNQMQGDFQGATVIVMGCQSLGETSGLPAAFIHKGASVYVGWDDSVGLTYTDASTANLIRIIAEGKPVEYAVQRVAAYDPFYHGRLVFSDARSLAVSQLDGPRNLIIEEVSSVILLAWGPIALGLFLRRLWRL